MEFPVIKNYCEGCKADSEFVFLEMFVDQEGDENYLFECHICESQMLLNEDEANKLKKSVTKK